MLFERGALAFRRTKTSVARLLAFKGSPPPVPQQVRLISVRRDDGIQIGIRFDDTSAVWSDFIGIVAHSQTGW